MFEINTDSLMFPGGVLCQESLLTNYLRPERVAMVNAQPELVDEQIRVISSRDELQVVNNAAIIPIHGPIEYKLSFWGWLYGGCSSQKILAQYEQAVNDSQVTKVIFDIDSPGGTYVGMPECGKTLFDMRGQKPTVAVVNPMCASGALWLGRSVEKMVILGSGDAGSIGAITMVQTYVEYFKMLGVEHWIARAPELKALGTPYEEIAEEFKEHARERIEEIAEEFIDWIAKTTGVRRNIVANDFGRGRMLKASEAVDVGLCDAIGSLSQEVNTAPRLPIGRKTRRVEAVSKFASRSLGFGCY